MNAWLVTIGEPVPLQPGTRDRLHRTGYFARFLAEHGHNVTWWTSTFDHFRKHHIVDDDAAVRLHERLQVRLLHGCGYRRNLSLSRFRDHRQIARKFAKMVRQATELPDIIVAAYPTIELPLEAVRFGRANGIPVVIDLRDMWPDIFVDSVPKLARPVARVTLEPMFREARLACSGATALTGITEAFIEWGLGHGRRERTSLDRSFPLGYVSTPPPSDQIRQSEEKWDRLGITSESGFVVCFFGSIGRQFDLGTAILAARRLRQRDIPVRLVVCGTGDRLDDFKKMAADDPNILFPGWVDASDIHVLLRRSTVGIDPLPDRYDFLSTINNKAIEYMSAGRPVVSCPRKGVLFDLLSREGCGLSYAYGDVEGLADLLCSLLADRDLLEKMASNSARVFGEMFAAEKVYSDMMAYLQGIIERSGSA